MTTGLMLITAVVAAAAMLNWATRGPGWPLGRQPWAEWFSKPLTTIGLIALAATLDPADAAQQRCVVAGLVLCLIGDIALMLPTELFRTGLVSFLLGHVAFIVGFVERGTVAPLWSTTTASAVAAACIFIALRHLLPAVRREAPALFGPVVAYVVVILTMVVASTAGQHWAAPVGAATFAVSDLTLADNKFVTARRWSPLLVMITYHLALALIVLSLRPLSS